MLPDRSAEAFHVASRPRKGIVSRCDQIEDRGLPFVGNTIRYHTVEEFNVDSKAECGQLNLAHVARNKNKTPVPT